MNMHMCEEVGATWRGFRCVGPEMRPGRDVDLDPMKMWMCVTGNANAFERG